MLPKLEKALFFSLAIISLCSMILSGSQVLAAGSDSIEATVRIPVCGDLVAESPEDCDGDDLAGGTCRSEGFDDGVLTCDVACDYDTSQCYGVAPTPTPSPTPTPEGNSNSSSSNSGSSSSNTSSSTTTSSSAPTASPVPRLSFLRSEIIDSPLVSNPLLPPTLQTLDPNKDGQIEKDEVGTVVELWKNSWEKFTSLVENNQQKTLLGERELALCDVNSDQTCSLVDFSILLWFVATD